jgi:predicted RNA-binding protein with PIN domain
VGWTSRLRDDACPFILDLLLIKDGWRYRTLHQDLSSVLVRQNLITARGKLVTAVADFRQTLGINFNELHC